jgi:hypothetical protein
LALHPGVFQFSDRGNLSVARFCRISGIRLIVGDHDATLPRGDVAPDTGVVGVAEPVVRGVKEPPEHYWVGHTGKSHSVYSCEVVGGSLPAEPWDDSSPAEALGSLAVGTWRPGRTLRVAVLVLTEATYAVAAPRRPMGKRGPETERSLAGAAIVSLEGTSRCEATRAARRRSVRACRERWPERRQRRGAEGPAASVLAGVGMRRGDACGGDRD